MTTTSSFFVEPKVLKLRDVEVSVSPLPVKSISKAATAAAPLIDALSRGEVNPVMVLENADSVIQLCAIATNQSEEWIGELNAAELVALVTLVVSVNSDFFIQSIMPQITTLMQSVKTTAEKATPKDQQKLGKAASTIKQAA